MADYILTFTKTRFYPLEPDREDIKIEDIAHALSLMTRANGHFRHFYSVAQHSIGCCREACSRGYSKRVQLGCLLHDASESYISDLTRPVKRNLPEYFKIEDRLQKVIYHRFGLGDISDAELLKISSVDDSLLYYEFYELMEIQLFENRPQLSAVQDFSQRSFADVEEEFLGLFRELAEQ